MSKWLIVHWLNNHILRFDYFKARRAVLLSVLCFCMVSSVISCKKDKFQNNNTGKEILSDEELLDLSMFEFTGITTKTKNVEPLRTDEISSTILLGSYVDPVFGKSSAEIYTQLRLESAVDFLQGNTIADIQIDSIFLQLPLTSFYGVLDAQTFEVYQLSEGITLTDTYYSNNTRTTNPTNYVKSGTESITPNTTASVVIDGETKVPMLRIELDPSFGDLIINENGNPSLAGNDNADGFVSWFKGLRIKTNTTQASGEGAILAVNIHSDEAKIVMNYKNNGTPNKFSFLLGTQIAYFNHFEHDYTSTPVETALNNSASNAAYYVQSMSGTQLELNFTDLAKFAPSEDFVVNKAELILPVEYDAASAYSLPNSIFVLGYNTGGETIFLPDQFLGNIGGGLNTTANTYTFNITSYVNKVISGEWGTDTKLTVNAVGSAISATRFVGKSRTSTTEKPILKLYYTTY